MTLHDAIQKVLKDNNSPMRVREIADKINQNGYYNRDDGQPVEVNQIYARVKNYPSLFQNLNGQIVLLNDTTWKNILSSYEYLSHSLKGFFIQADVQFVIAVLFCYKRLVDINSRSGRNYPLSFDKTLSMPIERLFDGGKSLISAFRSFEDLFISPTGTFEECARLLSKLDGNRIQELWSVVSQIKTNHLDDFEFGSLYEYILTQVSLDDIKSSLNHTPFSLRQLMAELLQIKDGSSIYDPVAGIGGLLIETAISKKKDIHFFGSEINRRVAQLGNLNILMHGLTNIHLVAEDCFEQINSNKTYDYLIADLPANGITNSVEYYMLYNHYNLVIPKSGKSFGALVLFALSKLKSSGKAVLAVSDGFLTKKGKEREIRELLIERDVVETVISLPYGTLRPYTDAKISLLILNRDKPSHFEKRIHFITGRASEQTSRSLILDSEQILNSYAAKEVSGKDTNIVDIDDLRPDLSLLAESYDAQFLLANTMMKEGRAQLLGDIVLIKSGATPDKSSIFSDGDIPLIKVERLSKDILDINLGLEVYEGINDEDRHERNIISEQCILVARIGDYLKATIFTPSDSIPKILPHSNLYALIPNKKLDISIEYLYYQLHSAFVQEQIARRRLGAVMPFISIAGIKETVIPYMSLDSQNEFVESQKANLISEERNRVEERIKALGYKEETKQAEADVIKILTHQLRPTFSGLNGITRRIKKIIEMENLGQLTEYKQIELDVDPEIEDQIARPDNFNLTQLVNKLSYETNHLSDILTNVDKVMNFKILPEDLSENDMFKILTEYKARKDVEQNSRYSIEVIGDSVFAFIHKPSFNELLDQLLLNAERHAFSDSNPKKGNKIIFSVRYISRRNVVSIDYSNNGKPYELTQRDFTTAFEKGNRSKGSGIGGNYISRIIEAHGGKLIVEEKNKKGFSLTIELPSSNNKIYE